jgi:hypothetical protein
MDPDNELRSLGYKYLDWANGWSESPEEVIKCKELGHKTNNHSYSHRGLHNTVSCDICKYYYNYDSSD